MRLADVLEPSRCLADQRFADKAACLGDLARRAGMATGLPAGLILEAVIHRETLGSTGLGDGIALPHARLAEIASPIVIVTRLRETIEFDAVDERPVDIVCLVLLPAAKTQEALNLLAALARGLRDKPTARAIRKVREAGELYTLMTSL